MKSLEEMTTTLRDWLQRTDTWTAKSNTFYVVAAIVAEAMKKPGVIVYCVEDTKSIFHKLQSAGFDPKRDGDLLSGSFNEIPWSFVVVAELS